MLKASRGSLVSAQNLIAAVQKNPKIRILNTSITRPLVDKEVDAVYKQERIPKSTLVNIDEVHDTQSPFSHQTPLEKEFNQFMRQLDIRKSDDIVLYDDNLIAGPCKFWWTFREYGKDVYILDGCFDAWKKAGGPIETGEPTYKKRTDQVEADEFKRVGKANLTFDDVNACSYMMRNKSLDYQIVDARSGQRFRSEVPEPRPGLRSGNIPGSVNLFFKDLLTEDGKSFKSTEQIVEVLRKAGVDPKKPTVMSCGSSVTASVLDYALYILGLSNERYIYQGSWSEYGKSPQLSDAEIAEKCIPKSAWFKSKNLTI